MRLKSPLVFLLVLLSVSFCKSPKDNTSSSGQEQTYVVLANQEINSPFKYFFNSTGQYVLCVHTPREAGKLYDLEYTVIDVKNQKVMIEGSKIYGEVKWADEKLLKLVEYPRVLKNPGSTDENIILYQDIITKEKKT